MAQSVDAHSGRSSSPEMIKCTYPDCDEYFDTHQDMIDHKCDDPDHFYCRMCNVDCVDWEDELQHKVDAMQPWLQARADDDTTGVRPKHICCEFCGADFKSFGGRKVHLERNHRAQQHITCPGCKTVFGRAADMAAHLELGRCSAISSRDFIKSAEQKRIVKQIMADPGQFMDNLAISKAGMDASDVSSYTTETATTTDDVDLLDMDDAMDSLTVSSTNAASQVTNPTKAGKSRATESWPRLPGQMEHSNTAESAIHRSSESQINASVGIEGVESNPSWPSVSTQAEPVRHATTGAWTSGQTSKTLFPDAAASPVPGPGEWEAHLAVREAAAADQSSNLFYSRFWDPSDPQYNPDMFYNAITRKHFCPFATCDQMEYDTRTDIETHIRMIHAKKRYQCPMCSKGFRSASALIGHCESAGKCKIKHSDAYAQIIDELSGGYLRVEAVAQPRLHCPETALVQEGQILHGVTTHLFSAKLPHER